MTKDEPQTHPARLSVEVLLRDCVVQRTRRSGPGGQHRNKVETAVVLTHQPTGIAAEAGERRSQKENHNVAVQRLRVNLALKVRSVFSESSEKELPPASPLWRSRCQNRRIAVNEDHQDFPALLAEVLDLWMLTGRDLKAAADHLDGSLSQLVKFLKKEPRALKKINDDRQVKNLSAFR